jgi:hypothetical protein
MLNVCRVSVSLKFQIGTKIRKKKERTGKMPKLVYLWLFIFPKTIIYVTQRYIGLSDSLERQ